MMQGSLARKLRILRAERGLTQERAAGLIGITPETLSDLERGKRRAYGPTLSKIAKGYVISVEELIEEPALPLGDDASQEAGQREVRGPDPNVWGEDADRPKTLPKSDVTHQREVHDKISVSDDVKARLSPQFDALIYMLETSGLSKQAAVVRSLRDEIMVA